MNKKRRNKIRKLHDKIEEFGNELQEIIGEEEKYIENVPENLQSTDKYITSERCICFLESSLDGLYGILMDLNECIGEE